MTDRPRLTDEDLENITTLALLTGRFEKIQQIDPKGSDPVLMDFAVVRWDDDRPFRKSLSHLEEHYPIVKQYIQTMDSILAKQEKYRTEHNIETLAEWRAKQVNATY